MTPRWNRVRAWARRWRAMIVGALVLLPAMVWLSGDFGVTWDELPRQAYGERIWAFYEGRHGYERFPADGSHLYAGLFEVSAVALQQVLPLNTYVVRHGLNALFGWTAIVFCGVLAARIQGQRAGLLAMTLLALSPRFFGHSMNNPKDIPFAAMAAAALYAMALIPSRYPWLPVRVAAALAVTIGLSLSIRPGGLLFLAYAGVVLAVAVLRARDFSPRHLLVTAAAFGAVVLVATTIPLPLWPWLQTRPYLGLLEAASGVSQFEWFGKVLFEGRAIEALELPWTYVPVWLLYTTPPVVLAGAVLSVARLRPRAPGAVAVAGVWLAFLFPIAYVIVKHSTLYDGIRHLLFILPPLAVLAALGWSWLLGHASRGVRIAGLVLLAVGLAEPLIFQVRNHPNQVVYFNHLLGGPRNAFGRFELDYWGNCLHQALERAVPMARQSGMVVLVSGHRWRMMLLDSERTTEIRSIRPELRRHHLEVTLFRGPPESLAKFAARQDVLYRVAMADGTPLCAVTPGPAYGELRRRLVE